jgi:chemotaxis protein MotB
VKTTRKRRRSVPSHVSHERWLVSYADFITLLFAFFTTMYAISTVDAKKLSSVVASMQTAFASDGAAARGNGGMPQKLLLPAPPQRGQAPRAGGDQPGLSVKDVETRLRGKLASQVANGLVDLAQDPRGLVVSIREAGTFSSGRSDLSPEAQAVLAELASALLEVGNSVRVEGHTDDVPIHNDRFASNWELSTARATSVVAYLLERGVPPERLSAAGYGEFHPREPNDSGGNRARNRRVDVVVLNPVTQAREEPVAAPAVAGPAAGR